ncbi:uncharacterized protein LOC127246281 [Andrographis paniculata]|uniref:uncharacterized protein LOC127246281 n=1 Tax=Andrographis paniculata TaxID=175694 RepID=UPI0021E9934F|nr:uncharacterized protein LOC127246281 [Andrographis paniculata]
MNLIATTGCTGARLCWGWPGNPTPERELLPTGYIARSFPVYRLPSVGTRRSLFIASAKKKNSKAEQVLKPSIIEEVYVDKDGDDGEEDDIFIEDFDDDELEGDTYFEDDYFEEEAELAAGDGAGGGGIALAGTEWDRTALEIAEEVVLSFDDELGIYAFRTLLNATIQIRVERLTNKSGSPSMEDIEAFSTKYRARLDEAESDGSIPGNISLEVSSPGVERVLRIPEDLDRFKDRNLYVKYMASAMDTGALSEHDGVFRLMSFDSEAKSCTWGLANVRINREKSGKGRPLSKKQKEWRLSIPLDAIRLVRLYSEM